MKILIEWLPTIISAFVSLGGVAAVLSRVHKLDEIKELKLEIKCLRKSLREQREDNKAILERLTMIERNQRGISSEDKQN